MRTSTIAAVLVLLPVSPLPVAASDWSAVERCPAHRTVTVHLNSGQKLKGTIQQADADGLRLARKKWTQVEGKESVRIARPEISRITWRSRSLGALIGLGAGVGAGAAYGANVNFFRDDGVTRRESVAAGATFFGIFGAIGGAIIGVPRTLYSATP